MPPTMPPVQELTKEEKEARVSILHHRQAEQRLTQARTALDQAADTGFADVNAVQLIEDYEDARDECEDCEKSLGKVVHIPKDDRKALERHVEEKNEKLPTLKFQAQMTDADFRNWQQDQERARIEREGQWAAAERGGTGLPQFPQPTPAQPAADGSGQDEEEARSQRTGAARTANPKDGGAAVLHGAATHDAGRKPAPGTSRRGGPVTTREFEEAGKDDLGSRQVPAGPRGGGTPSRPGAPQNPAAGTAANRVADPSLAEGNEPAADARKADTDKDVRPGQPREGSELAEEQRRTGVAKQ